MKQQAMGHEVCVITSDRYMPSTRFFGNIVGNRIVGTGKFYEEGISVYRLPCFFELEGIGLLMHGIKKVLSTFKPDVIHCHDIISSILIAAAFYKELFNYVLVADSITGTFQPRKIKKMAYGLYKYAIFFSIKKKVDRFFAISEGARIWLCKEFGVPYEDITFIPLGADIDLFKPNALDRNEIRQQFGIKDNDVLMVFSGKMLPEKDLTTLISALACLPYESKNRVRILLIGSGPKYYVDEILELAQKNGILKNIHFHPPVNRKKLAEYYNAADIGVWPGNPSNSTIEAMSAGLPIIIARQQPLQHDAFDTFHLLEYKNGLSFKRGSAKGLATCIEELVKDEKLRRDMSIKGRKLVEEKLNWNKISKMTLETYEQILSRK
jgi:glycosyltransferase involved in cell wall biosynthesis